jgi:hypothetical protein
MARGGLISAFDSALNSDRTPRGVAQSGSAFGWGPKGRWFKSSRPDLAKPPRMRRFCASRARALHLARGPIGVQFRKLSFGSWILAGLVEYGTFRCPRDAWRVSRTRRG